MFKTSEHLGVGSEQCSIKEGFRLLRFGHDEFPTIGASKIGGSNGATFSPSWSIKNDPCLPLFESAIDFSKNAFLHGT